LSGSGDRRDHGLHHNPCGQIVKYRFTSIFSDLCRASVNKLGLRDIPEPLTSPSTCSKGRDGWWRLRHLWSAAQLAQPCSSSRIRPGMRSTYVSQLETSQQGLRWVPTQLRLNE
jgi:hypothetical protein